MKNILIILVKIQIHLKPYTGLNVDCCD